MDGNTAGFAPGDFECGDWWSAKQRIGGGIRRTRCGGAKPSHNLPKGFEVSLSGGDERQRDRLRGSRCGHPETGRVSRRNRWAWKQLLHERGILRRGGPLYLCLPPTGAPVGESGGDKARRPIADVHHDFAGVELAAIATGFGAAVECREDTGGGTAVTADELERRGYMAEKTSGAVVDGKAGDGCSAKLFKNPADARAVGLRCQRKNRLFDDGIQADCYRGDLIGCREIISEPRLVRGAFASCRENSGKENDPEAGGVRPVVSRSGCPRMTTLCHGVQGRRVRWLAGRLPGVGGGRAASTEADDVLG